MLPASLIAAKRDHRELSDEEIAAITTYERNAWGNNTDDEIQPADVATVRKDAIQQPKMVKKAQAGGLQ